jgi:hypothetical protein
MYQTSHRRSLACALAVLAAACAGEAFAGMFATEAAVGDFTFERGQVVYTLPSVAELQRGLASDSVLGPSAVGGSSSTDLARFNPRLRVGPSPDDSQRPGAGGVMTFGSIPPAEDSDTLELMKGVLDSMQIDGGDDSLAFLVPDSSATGALANEFRSFGLYSVVSGLDVVDWLGQHSSAGSVSDLTFSQLEREAAGQGAGGTSAIPSPATPLLMLAGLLSLRFLGRRRS